MIFKIQKPLYGEQCYLSYNKTKSIMFNDIVVGDFPELDNMFEDRNKIYIEGYLDKKDRLIIKRQVEEQEW